ncbi:MAG: hypothetical protein IAG13_22120 [Deltaproteobacteria bacterium]|nr:hypothetical protein [Nannocystaceae bacterium]
MRLFLRCLAPLLIGSIACSGDDEAAVTADDSSSSSGDSSTTNSTTTPAEESSSDESNSLTDPSDTSSADSSSGSTGPTESTDPTDGSICGDFIISGNEECDCEHLMGKDGVLMPCAPQDLGEFTCLDVTDPTLGGPITGGVLNCNPTSCRFDTSQCVFCGDGDINGNEECEPDENVNSSCSQLGAGVAGEVTCTAACTVDTTACTDCLFEFDFETDSCPDGFSTSSLMGGAGASSWACGEPTVYGLGPGVASPGAFGTNLSGPYNANEISALVSSEIDMSVCTDAGITMTMRHWHNFEGGELNADGGIVQVSEDGVEWTTVAPVDGRLYDMDAMLDASFPPVDGVYGFSGGLDENSWGTSEFDLSDFMGSSSLQVRFVFGSNGSVQAGGWYIDSMSVLGSGAGI